MATDLFAFYGAQQRKVSVSPRKPCAKGTPKTLHSKLIDLITCFSCPQPFFPEFRNFLHRIHHGLILKSEAYGDLCTGSRVTRDFRLYSYLPSYAKCTRLADSVLLDRTG